MCVEKAFDCDDSGGGKLVRQVGGSRKLGSAKNAFSTAVWLMQLHDSANSECPNRSLCGLGSLYADGRVRVGSTTARSPSVRSSTTKKIAQGLLV